MSLILPVGFAAAEDGAMAQIMKGLGENMTRIGDGIWRDEFTEVARAAEGIAKHPLPPLLERLELLAELGPDATQFMKSDDELKDAAKTLMQAAEERQIEEVVESYQLLQRRCVACHTWYRGIQTQEQTGMEN